MPYPRNEILTNGEVYHVLNRSIANEDIFKGRRILNHTLDLVDYYRFPQKIRFSIYNSLPVFAKNDYFSNFRKQPTLVEIFAFALMPTHYHLLVKQLQDGGIKKFISRFQNSFAKYFNKKFKRQGSVFLRPFKAKRIFKDSLLLHVSRYIHLNPITSYLINFEELGTYPWTSYPYYLGEKKPDLVNTKMVLDIAGSNKRYHSFLANQVDYQRRLNKIKNLILE